MDFIDLKSQQKIIRHKINKRIDTVLDHGKYIMGPEVFELEELLCDYVGAKHCISCSSGTDALLIPLMAKGIGPGDAVFTTPFTYIATAEVISLLGAYPVFVDIYPSTFNIDPSGIKKAIDFSIQKFEAKSNYSSRFVWIARSLQDVRKTAEENNLFLIQDTAQGFGSSVRGKRSGSFGDVSSTSFFPAKPLGCYGDGGAIFTDNENLAEIMKSIRVHGSSSNKYDNIRVGINGRLDTIQAAILLEFSIFDAELIQRNQIAQNYNESIGSKFQKPYVPDKYFSSWAQYSLLAKNEDHKKDYVVFEKNNVPTMTYYKTPLHLQNVFLILIIRLEIFQCLRIVLGEYFLFRCTLI